MKVKEKIPNKKLLLAMAETEIICSKRIEASNEIEKSSKICYNSFMQIPLYIFDLDGTLALIDHRRYLIDSGNWTTFYSECINDLPNQPVINTMESLMASGAEAWIFSGRSDEVREETINWLEKYTIFSRDILQTHLVMRQAGDYTPDDVLKKQFLDNMLLDDRKRLVAVFDDREKVVQMWRSEGIACFQVAPGEF